MRKKDYQTYFQSLKFKDIKISVGIFNKLHLSDIFASKKILSALKYLNEALFFN
jgi:hypothetical protein